MHGQKSRDGSASIESEFDDRVASPFVLEEIVKVESDGYDAAFVSCMGVRSIDAPVLELGRRRSQVLDALVNESRKLIDHDDADSIILGCTGLVGMARDVQKRVGVPVLDPTPVSVKFAELLLTANLTHSARAYQKPPAKLRRLPGTPRLSGKSIELEA